jgi:hypothetical protein
MASVVGTGEILLNDKRYRISGPVRKTLVSIAAPRFTIGDTQRGADPRASILTQNDFRGGIGWNRGLDPGSIDRVWWSSCQTRFKGHVLLPRASTAVAKATKTDGSPTGELNSIIPYQVTGEAAESIYAVFRDGDVRRFADANNSWELMTANADGSTPLNLTNPSSESITFTHTDGVNYLIFAQGDTGYTWTKDALTFTSMAGSSNAAHKVAFFTIWHGTLWGISEDGTLKNWASGPETAATSKAKLPLPNGYVTSLLVYRNASGSPIIYATTKTGLWAYDETNNRWEETELRTPFHVKSGLGAIVWRDAIYFPVGNAIYKYQTGSNTAVVSLVGFDKDHGVPEGYRGQIQKLIGTHNDLLALVNADVDITYTVFPSAPDGIGSTVINGTGTSAILGYNEQAWEVKWTGENSTGLRAGAVGSPYRHNTNSYRLWFVVGADMYWTELSPDVINPDQISEFQYALAGTLETPWFDGGDAAGAKTALTLRAITSGCSANVNIAISYAVNFSESYTSLGTITSSSETTTYDFASGVGVEFSSIKFKADFASNSASSSPDLNLIELRWREKIPAKYGFSVTVDAAKSFRGSSPKQMLDNITTVINTDTLVNFTYKDDDSDRTYYVDLVSAAGFEFTGHDERGQIQIQLVET